jgi:hypothetical protein
MSSKTSSASLVPSSSLSSSAAKAVKADKADTCGLSNQDTVLLRRALSETFFRTHPVQMKLCNFAIDAVVQNAADYAMSRVVVPAGEDMVRDVQTLELKHHAGQGLSLKNIQLELLRKHREAALRESLVHAFRYCDQFVPKVLLNVAPSNMVRVRDDPASGELCIEPAPALLELGGEVAEGIAVDATGTTLVAAIPLILDLTRKFVREKLERRVKIFFRLRMDKWQAQLGPVKSPTIMANIAKRESKQPQDGNVVVKPLRADAAASMMSRKPSKKIVSRMTSSGKLLCSFIPHSESQRFACLAILEIARLIRQYSATVLDLPVYRLSVATAEGTNLQHFRELDSKASAIVAMIDDELQLHLRGFFVDQSILKHDLELLRLIITGPIVESLVVCLIGVTGRTNHNCDTDSIVMKVLKAIVGVVGFAKRACPGVIRGVFECVVHRLMSGKDDSLAMRVECFSTIMRVGGALTEEEVSRCNHRFRKHIS